MDQKPSVGRIVHFQECNAAIVVAVNEDESLNLVGWENDGTQVFVPGATNWHWPERV